jgi:hypothetical protein
MSAVKHSTWAALLTALTVAGCAIDPADPGEGQARAELTASKPATARHCVMSVESGALSCFATFPEAVAVATAGRIVDAPSDARAAVRDPAFLKRVDALPPLAADHAAFLNTTFVGMGVVLGIEFSDAGWGGSTLQFATPLGCDGNHATIDAQVAVMPAGWNDEISSFHSPGTCQQILYADGGFSGQRTPKTNNMLYVGDAMNDQASTIRFF